MNPTNTGGQAFPVGGVPGMTLRDYFAIKVVHSAIASPVRFVDEDGAQIGTPDGYASLAYAIADAMLKAREAA